MARLPRPGCVLRTSLVLFGLLFLPMAIFFAYESWTRYWGRATVLGVVSVVFLWLGLSRNENSWVTMVDDLEADDRR